MPETARLRHTVHRLLDTTDAIATVGAFGLIAFEWITEYRLAFEQLALEVGGDEILPAHAHAGVCGELGKYAK